MTGATTRSQLNSKPDGGARSELNWNRSGAARGFRLIERAKCAQQFHLFDSFAWFILQIYTLDQPARLLWSFWHKMFPYERARAPCSRHSNGFVKCIYSAWAWANSNWLASR